LKSPVPFVVGQAALFLLPSFQSGRIFRDQVLHIGFNGLMACCSGLGHGFRIDGQCDSHGSASKDQGNRTLSLGFWIEFCIDGVPVKG
jgi:hypothetical protein